MLFLQNGTVLLTPQVLRDLNVTDPNEALQTARPLSDVPRIEPLLEKHLDNAVRCQEKAFSNDPLHLYIVKTPDERKRSELEVRIFNLANKKVLAHVLRFTYAFTIGGGDAGAIATPASPERRKPSPSDRVKSHFITLLARVAKWFYTPEQRKRIRELETKHAELVERLIGNRADAMIYLNLLYTAPEFQGLGYGSALLNTVLFIADVHGRDTYLTSSNINNNPFYESFGFEIIGELVLGASNPRYNGKPVVVTLMERKAKSPEDRLANEYYDEKELLA